MVVIDWSRVSPTMGKWLRQIAGVKDANHIQSLVCSHDFDELP